MSLSLRFSVGPFQSSHTDGAGSCPGDSSDSMSQVLPDTAHWLLPQYAFEGRLHLVKALLPNSQAPLPLRTVYHYVKASTFLAAAAGGKSEVLADLLFAGAEQWACQLPGDSLMHTAMDLAAQAGHLHAAQLLSSQVKQPSSSFLTAAADSNSRPIMQWVVTHWFSQFNALTGFNTSHVQQLLDALGFACLKGNVTAIQLLLCHLHAVRCHSSCVYALSYLAKTDNIEALRCVLESPCLPQQLERVGRKVLIELVEVTVSCLSSAICSHNCTAVMLLLGAITTSSSSALAAVRPHLEPHMLGLFDTAAAAGNSDAVQLLLMQLPEHYQALRPSAYVKALAEGHAETASSIRTLLFMRGPEEGVRQQAVCADTNPQLVIAQWLGRCRSAVRSGNVAELQQLLLTRPATLQGFGVDTDVVQLLQLAASGSSEAVVRLLLAQSGSGACQEESMQVVCGAAVANGQLALLQVLAADRPSPLLHYLAAQPGLIAEYLRAALLANHVGVAAWLVGVAAQEQQLGVVAATLQDLLAVPRWQQWKLGVRNPCHVSVLAVLKTLIAGLRRPTNSTALTPASPARLTRWGSDVTDPSAVEPAVAASLQNPESILDQLLTPQMLSLLLHAAAGEPSMLATAVSLAQGNELAGQCAAAGTDGAATQHQEQHAQTPMSVCGKLQVPRGTSAPGAGVCCLKSTGSFNSEGDPFLFAASSSATMTSISSSGGSPSSMVLTTSNTSSPCAFSPSVDAVTWQQPLSPLASQGSGLSVDCDGSDWLYQQRQSGQSGTVPLQWPQRADGVVTIVGTVGSNNGKAKQGMSAVLAPAALQHQLSLANQDALPAQDAPIKGVVEKQRHWTGFASSAPSPPMIGQLIGKVQQYPTPSSPCSQQRRPRQQEQRLICTRDNLGHNRQGESQYQSQPSSPLRIQASLPLPKSNHTPVHPYMHVLRQQPQQQRQQGDRAVSGQRPFSEPSD